MFLYSKGKEIVLNEKGKGWRLKRFKTLENEKGLYAGDYI